MDQVIDYRLRPFMDVQSEAGVNRKEPDASSMKPHWELPLKNSSTPLNLRHSSALLPPPLTHTHTPPFEPPEGILRHHLFPALIFISCPLATKDFRLCRSPAWPPSSFGCPHPAAPKLNISAGGAGVGPELSLATCSGCPGQCCWWRCSSHPLI